MIRVPDDLLRKMATRLDADQRAEMAIPSYLHPNPALRWMAWRRLEVLARRLEKVCGERPDHKPTIMDFGCGSGSLFGEANRFAERIYGVDLIVGPAELLVAEWNLDTVELMTPPEAEAEIPEKTLDIILAAEVLEHIESLGPTLEFFRSRLRDHGRLLVSLPTEGTLYRLGRRWAGFSGEYHRQAAAGVHDAIMKAGFVTESLKTIPAPGPLAIYWVIDYRKAA